MTTYTDLFTSYIVNGARQALAQVQESRGRVPESVRAQAWHLLDYALGVEAAWPQVRELLLELAPQMEMAGYRDEWLPFLQAGVARSAGLADAAVEAQLCLAVGKLLRLENRYPEAERWLERARVAFQDQDDPRGVATVHNQLGRIRYLQRRIADAIDHAQQALARLALDDPERAESHFVLGMAALNQRQWATAEQEHLHALELRRRSDNRRAVAWAMQNVGVVLLQQSEYGGVDRLEQARTWLEEAVALLDALPDPYHAAVARNSLGIVHRLQGQLTQAIALFVQAEEAFQATHSPEWQARIHNNLGLAYLNAAQPAEAERSFRAGVALYEQLENAAARLNTQHGVVLALLAQNRYAEAAALCRRGLAELDVLRDVPAEYAEKEGWYQASLAKAEAGLG